MIDNILRPKSWNNAQKNLKNRKSINSYFNILSFGEIIDESKQLIQELNNNNLTQDIAIRSKLLFSELNSRISSDTQYKSLKEMREEQNKKIDNY